MQQISIFIAIGKSMAADVERMDRDEKASSFAQIEDSFLSPSPLKPFKTTNPCYSREDTYSSKERVILQVCPTVLQLWTIKWFDQ